MSIAPPPVPRDQRPCETHSRNVAGATLTDDQTPSETQKPLVVGPVPATKNLARTNERASRGPQLTDDHRPSETQPVTVVGAVSSSNGHGKPSPDQWRDDTQSASVGGEHASGQVALEPQTRSAAGVLLKLAAEFLNDIERARTAMSNRVAAWSREPERGGLGLPTDLPEYARLVAIHDALHAAEHLAELELVRMLRTHPLGPWVKRTLGVGPKQGARLIAAIGDPYWNSASDRPRRGAAELWAYCGYHTLPAEDQTCIDTHRAPVPGGKNIAARRRKGQRANWNAEAKMRAFLIAESCMKCRASPYRTVYDNARVKHAEAVHDRPCPQCGPAGKPAAAGTPLSDGHKHARALREIAKAVLKDLFLEAKAIA